MLTLYRKYRPSKFEDVLGQGHIVRTLRNQIKHNRVGHGYLFTGTRGTGKTTLGRIFARTLNCTGNDNPCGECLSCKDTFSIIEIDAASHNGVDDIREINEEIKYAPAQGTYRIYIIDEVHMLSNGAFNALLKTLEEPPAHVIFILCTTDPQKIPQTVLSRVQRFDVKRISREDLVFLIKDVCSKEEIVIEERAVEYIAALGDGSARDTLSILEQVITGYFGEENISYENVLDLLGAVDKFIYLKLTQCIIEKNFKECVELFSNVIKQGRNIRIFVSDYITYLRGLLLLKYEAVELIDDSLDIYAGIEDIEEHLMLQLIKEMADLEVQLKYNPVPVLVELKLALVCSNSSPNVGELKNNQLDETIAKKSNDEQDLLKGYNYFKQSLSDLQREVALLTNKHSESPNTLSVDDEIMNAWDELTNSSELALLKRMTLTKKAEGQYDIMVPSYLIPYEQYVMNKLKVFQGKGISFNIVNV